MEFTSREIATGIIAAAFILLSIALNKDRKGLPRSLRQVAKAFAAWKVWTVVLAYLVFVAGVVVLAQAIGLWSGALLKETLIVGLLVGVPILFHSTEFKDGLAVVKHVVKKVLGITAILAVYLNLAPFPLWGELILQIFLLFCMMLAIVGKKNPKTAPVGKFFETLTALIGIGLLAYVTAKVASHFNEFNWEREASTFALSVWLPISLIPFIYLFGLMATCEATLVRMKFHNAGKALPLSTRLGFLLGVRGSLLYASTFTGHWLSQLANQKSFRDASRTMREYRQSVRHNAQQNRERHGRLSKLAGTQDLDQNDI